MYSVLLTILLFLSGCASNKRLVGHEGNLKDGENKPHIKISALYNKLLSQEKYHAVEIYFLNNSQDWERIKNIEISSVTPSKTFFIIDKTDIPAWKQSTFLDYELKLKEAKKNKTTSPSIQIKTNLERFKVEQYLGSPASLPASMQSFYWVLIRTPETHNLQTISLHITYLDSTEATYELNVPGSSK